LDGLGAADRFNWAVELAGCQAVVELAEHAVEEVPQCGGVAVSMVTAIVVAIPGGRDG
jgi:hypothetical protein